MNCKPLQSMTMPLLMMMWLYCIWVYIAERRDVLGNTSPDDRGPAVASATKISLLRKHIKNQTHTIFTLRKSKTCLFCPNVQYQVKIKYVFSCLVFSQYKISSLKKTHQQSSMLRKIKYIYNGSALSKTVPNRFHRKGDPNAIRRRAFLRKHCFPNRLHLLSPQIR